jgi:hypothetical protein
MHALMSDDFNLDPSNTEEYQADMMAQTGFNPRLSLILTMLVAFSSLYMMYSLREDLLYSFETEVENLGEAEDYAHGSPTSKTFTAQHNSYVQIEGWPDSEVSSVSDSYRFFKLLGPPVLVRREIAQKFLNEQERTLFLQRIKGRLLRFSSEANKYRQLREHFERDYGLDIDKLYLLIDNYKPEDLWYLRYLYPFLSLIVLFAFYRGIVGVLGSRDS